MYIQSDLSTAAVVVVGVTVVCAFVYCGAIVCGRQAGVAVLAGYALVTSGASATGGLFCAWGAIIGVYMVTFFFYYCGGVRVGIRATWRSMICSSVSTSSSASVAISSDIDAASDSGAGCALSFPFFDAILIWAGVPCFGLLDEGFSTSSSPNKPFGPAGMFIARSIMFGTDVVGVGAARASLQASRGLRFGRGSSLAGSFAYALIMASNFRISEAMSLYISAFNTAASAYVNSDAAASRRAGWAGGVGQVFSVLTSCLSSRFCFSNAVTFSV
jgi:hypothetical protein